MLAEHQRLILDKGLDAPEAVKVEGELRRRLGSYADTSIERLAREAAAKVVGDDLRSLTPERRREAQKQIAELLRDPAPAKPGRQGKGKATAKPRAKARRTGHSSS